MVKQQTCVKQNVFCQLIHFKKVFLIDKDFACLLISMSNKIFPMLYVWLDLSSKLFDFQCYKD